MKTGRDTVAVVGLGLIGGSLALGLMNKVGELRGLDHSERVLREARKRQMADVLSGDPAAVLPGAGLVLVALYPGATRRFIREHMEWLDPGTLILDVSGIKGPLVREIQGSLRPDLEFLGTHPMAGREGEGVEKAREEMFLGCTVVLTPTGRNTREALEQAGNLFERVGVREVVQMDPDRHDQLVAYTSQMPHVLAALLMQGYTEECAPLVGGSFQDATRVARINAPLWRELFLENRPNLEQEVARFGEQLAEFSRALADGDEEALGKILSGARARRDTVR